MASQSSFEIFSEDGETHRWRYLDERGAEVMVSANTFASSETAAVDIGRMQATVEEAKVWVQGTARTAVERGSSRWRPIAPDGTIGQPQPEPPDEPSEGETGPPETQELCQQPDCATQTAHFAH